MAVAASPAFELPLWLATAKSRSLDRMGPLWPDPRPELPPWEGVEGVLVCPPSLAFLAIPVPFYDSYLIFALSLSPPPLTFVPGDTLGLHRPLGPGLISSARSLAWCQWCWLLEGGM